MVSVRAFYSDDPSSNTADVCSFVCKNEFEKNEYKQKVAGVGPFFRIKRFYRHERERERINRQNGTVMQRNDFFLFQLCCCSEGRDRDQLVRSSGL